MTKISEVKKYYPSLNKTDKLKFLRNGLSENLAKIVFKIEENSFYQRIILKYITLDKTFLKKILVNEKYHNEIRLKALQNINNTSILFYKNILHNKRIKIKNKYYPVPYYNRISNYCKYKIASIPTPIRFIKEI
jgi:hypothetical protein